MPHSTLIVVLVHSIIDSFFPADIKVKIMRLIPQWTEGPGLQNWY